MTRLWSAASREPRDLSFPFRAVGFWLLEFGLQGSVNGK